MMAVLSLYSDSRLVNTLRRIPATCTVCLVAPPLLLLELLIHIVDSPTIVTDDAPIPPNHLAPNATISDLLKLLKKRTQLIVSQVH